MGELTFSFRPMRLSAERHFHRIVLPAWEVAFRVLSLPLIMRATNLDSVPDAAAAKPAETGAAFGAPVSTLFEVRVVGAT